MILVRNDAALVHFYIDKVGVNAVNGRAEGFIEYDGYVLRVVKTRKSCFCARTHRPIAFGSSPQPSSLRWQDTK